MTVHRALPPSRLDSHRNFRSLVRRILSEKIREDEVQEQTSSEGTEELQGIRDEIAIQTLSENVNGAVIGVYRIGRKPGIFFIPYEQLAPSTCNEPPYRR